MDDLAGLPENPTLRTVAETLEVARISGEVLDAKWRIRFISSELLRILGHDPAGRERYYGDSPIVREAKFGDEWGGSPETGRTWWRTIGPIIRHDVPPEDPDFEQVFGPAAEPARRLEPVDPPPSVTVTRSFPDLEGMTQSWLGDVRFIYLRIYDSAGRFTGILGLSMPNIPQTLANRLARGDTAMFGRMYRLHEPERRPAAILFADLASSGELSRRLASRAYFELIRSLTDLIDDEVSARKGILGKHAGDGASALFLAEDEGGESAAARAAIEAGRSIRDGAAAIAGEGWPEVRVRVGLHWGATLTVGQVSTRGRLEVTALGDEMNECARIESVARAGAALASKDLIERLSAADAEAIGLDPDQLGYRTVAELAQAEKAVRDAGQVAVTEV